MKKIFSFFLFIFFLTFIIKRELIYPNKDKLVHQESKSNTKGQINPIIINKKEAITLNKETKTNKKDKKTSGSSTMTTEVNQPAPPEFIKNMTGLFKSAKEKNWDKFNNYVRYLEGEDQASLNLSLYQAIINNAPIKIIENLLNRGATFSKEIIGILALQNNLALIKRLIPLGLDIYTVDSNGQSAIYYTLVTFQSKKTFDYLINKNISMKPDKKGLTPLDKALKYAIKTSKAIYYIDKLITYGARINTHHKNLLQVIKSNNIETYLKIIYLHPELID